MREAKKSRGGKSGPFREDEKKRPAPDSLPKGRRKK